MLAKIRSSQHRIKLMASPRLLSSIPAKYSIFDLFNKLSALPRNNQAQRTDKANHIQQCYIQADDRNIYNKKTRKFNKKKN